MSYTFLPLSISLFPLCLLTNNPKAILNYSTHVTTAAHHLIIQTIKVKSENYCTAFPTLLLLLLSTQKPSFGIYTETEML